MTLTKAKLSELRRIRDGATPGNWEDHNWDPMERPHVVAHSLWNGKDSCNGHFDVPCTPENTAYIAAFDPPTTGELLDRLESAEKALRFYANHRPIRVSVVDNDDHEKVLSQSYQILTTTAKAHFAQYPDALEDET